MFFVKTLFQSVIHSVNGGLAVFIAFHGIDVLLLDEEEKE